MRAISNDAHKVQNEEEQVGEDLLNNDPVALASDAQTAHDDYVNVRNDIAAAGSDVAGNRRLGNAENEMNDAINELKNGMGAVAAFASVPMQERLARRTRNWAAGSRTGIKR